MSMAENKQTAQNFINEILNKVNLENIRGTVTPDFVFHSVEEDLLGIKI